MSKEQITAGMIELDGIRLIRERRARRAEMVAIFFAIASFFYVGALVLFT